MTHPKHGRIVIRASYGVDDGTDRPSIKDGIFLSGGQRQRVAIAMETASDEVPAEMRIAPRIHQGTGLLSEHDLDE